jgi:hypothetical protein
VPEKTYSIVPLAVDCLYLECHVTFEPVFGNDLIRLSRIAASYGFKVADLLMQKRLSDTAERSKYDTFMTGHGQDMCHMLNRTAGLVNESVAAGFKIWRYKIEKAVIDSRHEDALNLGVGKN